MESIDKILVILNNLGSSNAETIAKIILLLLTFVGGIWFSFWKAKARRESAAAQRQRDRANNVSDNNRDEDQNSEDGASVRDRLKR